MRHYDYANMRSIDLTPANLAATTAWSLPPITLRYDYSAIVEAAPTGSGYAQCHPAHRPQSEQDCALLAAEAEERRHSRVR